MFLEIKQTLNAISLICRGLYIYSSGGSFEIMIFCIKSNSKHGMIHICLDTPSAESEIHIKPAENRDFPLQQPGKLFALPHVDTKRSQV